MFEAKVIRGDDTTYHPKSNPTATNNAFDLWFTFNGCPYSFKMRFFSQDQIEKAKAATVSGVAKFNLEPDFNTAPKFVLA